MFVVVFECQFLGGLLLFVSVARISYNLLAV
jgi:hypothetical protein